jgi:hypothetical protein
MNILALALLLFGALAVVIALPFALLKTDIAFDDTPKPFSTYLGLVALYALPLSMGWCVLEGWQAYRAGEVESAIQFAAYPAGAFFIGAAIVGGATLLRANASGKSESKNASKSEEFSESQKR